MREELSKPMPTMEETSALKLYLQVLWRRRWAFLLSATVVMGTMVAYTLTRPKVYESSLLLLVSGKEKVPQVVADTTLSNESDPTDSLDNEVQVLRTLPILTSAVEKLREDYPNMDASGLADALLIRQLGKSGIVSVAYQDGDPKRLIAVLNQLGKTYVNFGLNSRKSGVTSAIRLIESTLPTARSTLASRTKMLEQFRKQNNLIDPALLGSGLTKFLAELGEQERLNTVKIQENQALYQSLQQRVDLPPDQALSAASLNQDPIYTDLLKNYQDSENKYSLEQLRLGDDSPQLKSLRAKRDRSKQLLKDQVRQILGKNKIEGPRLNALQIAQVGQLLEAQNSIKVSQARAGALRSARRILEQDFQAIPSLQRRYEELDRQVKVAAENVDRLAIKLEDFKIIEAQEAAPWKVIQPPYAVGKPVSPNVPLNLLFGSVLAILVGGTSVYLREQFDNRISSVREVVKLLGLPLLGSLPRIDNKELLAQLRSSNKLLSEPDNVSLKSGDKYYLEQLNNEARVFSEALQYLSFNLRFICAEIGDRLVIGFTSPNFNDGKSTTIRYLSENAQERGLRVLLIDGDLRRPALHKSLNLTNQIGLSSVLTKDLPWRETIQRSGSLHVLTAGPTHSQVLPLLDSPKLLQVFLEMRDEYELVLVDLPPVVVTADPLLVAPHLDGLLIVVAANQVTTKDLLACQAALSQAQTRLLGVVGTMIKPKDIPYATYVRDLQESQPRPTFIRKQLLDRFLPNHP
jgi:capsular exopolysaccharide synthesis family protein